MFCKHCGAENPQGAPVCSSCGQLSGAPSMPGGSRTVLGVPGGAGSPLPEAGLAAPAGHPPVGQGQPRFGVAPSPSPSRAQGQLVGDAEADLLHETPVGESRERLGLDESKPTLYMARAAELPPAGQLNPPERLALELGGGPAWGVGGGAGPGWNEPGSVPLVETGGPPSWSAPGGAPVPAAGVPTPSDEGPPPRRKRTGCLVVVVLLVVLLVVVAGGGAAAYFLVGQDRLAEMAGVTLAGRSGAVPVPVEAAVPSQGDLEALLPRAAGDEAPTPAAAPSPAADAGAVADAAPTLATAGGAADAAPGEEPTPARAPTDAPPAAAGTDEPPARAPTGEEPPAASEPTAPTTAEPDQTARDREPMTPARYVATARSRLQRLGGACLGRSSARGAVTLTVALRQNGTVARASVQSNGTGDAELGRCLAGAMVDQRLGTPPAGLHTFEVSFRR